MAFLLSTHLAERSEPAGFSKPDPKGCTMQSPLSIALNIIWFVLGGFVVGTLWLLAAGVLALSVIGAPLAPGVFRIGLHAYWPFGFEVVPRSLIEPGTDKLGSGAWGLTANLVWFFAAGLWLGALHLLAAVASCVTLIGIPAGVAHFKLGIAAFAPVGKVVVPKGLAEEARRRIYEEAMRGRQVTQVK